MTTHLITINGKGQESHQRSLDLWRKLKTLTEWIEGELESGGIKLFPMVETGNTVETTAAFVIPADQDTPFETLQSGIIQRWRELDQGTIISIERLEEIVGSPQMGTADRTEDGMWMMDGEEMEDIFS